MQKQIVNPSPIQLISKTSSYRLPNEPIRKPAFEKWKCASSLDECLNPPEAQSKDYSNENFDTTDNNGNGFYDNDINVNIESTSNGFSTDVRNVTKKPRKNYELLSRVENARSGPWTQAEQTYAMKIIDEFEAGRLPEIPPKWTLRLLLSFKLQCPKMRISKKFGGRCRGKVILERSNAKSYPQI